ncbi:AB hydrolase-1 domain-containing protein [Mycena sanguinolenta]|uniref:AB hydrolase-1 domain-containing protein n=1 Tax=Mycena sanguinolenta TaxID=230812 RepID=A0A8H7DD62_9AGAR|nr:AB hydrolase-1 domain-containing protein [Mycena sanguinolenta]
MPLASQSFTFDPRPRYPLLLSVKRYWDPSSPHLDDPTAVTLVFTHGTGFHKEQYEPMIQDLYNFLPFDGPKIREVWSLDAPNHGDSAVLNEQALRSGYEPVFGWQEYARGLHALLAGLGTGVDVEFSKRRLVIVGHSMSAVVIGLALTYQPQLKPDFLIMVEMMGIHANDVPALMKSLTEGSATRRDIWPSRAEAYRLLKARPAWRVWDDRVLQIFVERGMRPLPTSEYPGKEGVTLKCTRRQETATYRDGLAIATVYSLMRPIVQRIPTHFIEGANYDALSRPVKDDFLANAVGGVQNLASFSRIPGAGHLVVQTHPTALAKAFLNILTKERDKLLQAKL